MIARCARVRQGAREMCGYGNVDANRNRPSQGGVQNFIGSATGNVPALMRRYEVSSRVNLVKNDDAECAEPVVRVSAA